MSKSARFAVSFLSLILTAPLLGAELRDFSDATRVQSLFPREARLRLVNLWATWCAPCVAEMPDLQAIDDAFGKELAIVGISLDDAIPGTDRSKVVRFLQNRNIQFPNAYYTGIPDRLGEALDYTGEIPITIIFDARGKELWRHQGRINKNVAVAKIRELLRRK